MAEHLFRQHRDRTGNENNTTSVTVKVVKMKFTTKKKGGGG